MPGTPSQLINAAKQGFKGTYGIMCHHAVFEWMVDSGYIAHDAPGKLFPSLGDNSSVFATILVNESDNPILNMNDLNQCPAGTIIGFWANKKIMHSIITIGDRMVAGVNNAGIFDPTGPIPKIHDKLRALFLTSQIGWNGDSTVGMDHYKVYAQSADVIAQRIATKAG